MSNIEFTETLPDETWSMIIEPQRGLLDLRLGELWRYRDLVLLFDGHRVFGLTRRIPELVEGMDIGVILYAIESIRAEEKKRILDLCRGTPARVILVPNLLATFREQLTQSLPGAVARAASAPSAPGSFGFRRDR